MVVIKKPIVKKSAVKKISVKAVKEKRPVIAKPKKDVDLAPREEAEPTAEVLEMPLENDFDAITLPEELLKNGADKSRYIEAVGRRKTSTARVRLFTQGKKGIIVNGKLYTEYFPKFLHKTIEDSLEKLKCLGKFGATVVVKGGGPTGQAEAVRHGLARTLVVLNPYFRKRLKKSGYLTRDPRMRERKKPGLKRARRAPQWSKR